MCASATTKNKTGLDMFLFLAGHPHSVALYFFQKKVSEQSHSHRLSQIVALCSISIFWLVSQKKKKGAEQALIFDSI